MPYTLQLLAPGSYDLFLDGRLVGGVVRDPTQSRGPNRWRAELLGEVTRNRRPPPFQHLEHAFPSFEAVLAWLGDATVEEAGVSLLTTT